MNLPIAEMLRDWRNESSHGSEKSFALIKRNHGCNHSTVDFFSGQTFEVDKLAEIDPILNLNDDPETEILIVIPYKQIQEREFVAIDDGARILGMKVTMHLTVDQSELLDQIADQEISLQNSHFDIGNNDYEEIVHRVIVDEIGQGAGANFVIKRTLLGKIAHYDQSVALSIYKNLLSQESGAFWTFLVYCNGHTFIGASPEQHIGIEDGLVSMNPISGTYRFPPGGPRHDELVAFLNNEKEIDELSMVLDEELKMMTRICDAEVKATGPYLIKMSNLAHTGYRLEGISKLPVSEVLRLSMFAPTVTGSPIENAARIIARYEGEGRSYYSGVLALINKSGAHTNLDSSILIRTAEIDQHGSMKIGVGATIVRESDPASETAETEAKVMAVKNALCLNRKPAFFDDESIQSILRSRNDNLSPFWIKDKNEISLVNHFKNSGFRVLIIDNEDTFTSMMEHQIRFLGLEVDTQHYSAEFVPGNNDLLIIGPGPGDPCNLDDRRIQVSRNLIKTALAEKHPFIAVCLGHQILSDILGLPIRLMQKTKQGMQKQIAFFGQPETVGFYNTFSAYTEQDEFDTEYGSVRVSRSDSDNSVYGLRGSIFSSMQFHPESVLTVEGHRILKESIQSAVSSWL